MFAFFELNYIWSWYLSCFPLLIDWLIDFCSGVAGCWSWSHRLAEIDREMYPVHELIGRQTSRKLSRTVTPMTLSHLGWQPNDYCPRMPRTADLYTLWTDLTPTPYLSRTSLELVSVDEQTKCLAKWRAGLCSLMLNFNNVYNCCEQLLFLFCVCTWFPLPPLNRSVWNLAIMRIDPEGDKHFHMIYFLY